MKDKRILVAYFSRTGEQYGVGTVAKGNTAIVAETIAKATGGTLFEIKPAKDVYPMTYDALIAMAKEEKKAQARPALEKPVDNFADYDVVFLGYPNWWGEAPMLLYTFCEQHDFTGKVLVPFVTHEGSGMGGTERKLCKAAGSPAMAEGYAVYGHTAQREPETLRAQVAAWLARLDS
ncbi:MAG: flavodoxin [Akkermansia sp.]|nr:flavodoxin [Akkermansia sp.]